MSGTGLARVLTLQRHILGVKKYCHHNLTLGALLVKPVPTSQLWTAPLGVGHSTYAYSDMASLETLNFDNLVLRTLPIDEEEGSRVREVKGACFSKVQPTAVNNAQTVVYSVPAMALLDLPEAELKRSEFADFFSGSKKIPGSESAAHCYCGHQFGNFAGQLGDGAAMYLGEVVNKTGERWELQLKGAGLTPFSRQADGRKVLRSSIREFLCSEAMHHLGIATTRAGSCITSDSTVIRDIYYTGNPIHEKCTIVSRIAPTFLRFGSFQICKPPDRETGREGPSIGRHDILEQMSDYVIKAFYPHIWEEFKDDKQAAYKEFFREVVLKTARLVADWQCVGWCHGVLNTDNMSIVGLTIDYGPYGFIDRFDPDYVCNGSDDGARYSYKNQPEMCKWNCLKLAEALQFIIPMTELSPVLIEFEPEFEKKYRENMRKKFGLIGRTNDEDDELISEFLDTMQKTGTDFTNSFRVLSKIPYPDIEGFNVHFEEVKNYLVDISCTLGELKKHLTPRIDPRQLQMFRMLMEMNPGVLQQMGVGYKRIAKEMEKIEKLAAIKNLTSEAKEAEDRQLWVSWLEKYVERLRFDCQAAPDIHTLNEERKTVMNQTNPRFILRNYIAQIAIEAAEKGDSSEVKRVLDMLQNPYSDEINLEAYSSPDTEVPGSSGGVDDESQQSAGTCEQAQQSYDGKPPSWAAELRVT